MSSLLRSVRVVNDSRHLTASMIQSRFQLEALEPRILLAADAALVEPLTEALSGGSPDMVVEASLEESVDTFRGFEAGGLFEGFDETSETMPAANQAEPDLPALPPAEERTETETDDAATIEHAVAATFKQAEPDVFQATLDDASPVVAEGDLNDLSSTFVSTLHAANAPPGQDGMYHTSYTNEGYQDAPDSPILQVIPEATVTWISDTDGFWDEGSNWSTGTAPTSIDSVLIDRSDVNVTVTVRGNVTVNYLISNESLALTGGTFTVSTEGELNGETEFTGGTLSGAANLNRGTIRLSGSGLKFLSGTLNNSGTIIHTDGVLAFSGGVLNNQSGALFDFAGDSSLRWWSGTQDFNNSGTVRKTGGTGVSSMTGGGSGISFNNTANGVIEVQTGTLMLNGSGFSSGGTFTVSTDAALDLTGGSTSNTFAGTYVGSGGGEILLQSGRLNLGENTVFNFPSGMFRWTGGSLSGGSLANSGFITITETGLKFLSTTLNNSGTIIHTDG
ncbi:MAG: LEPR-XLL domain-containing protein, partial [Verrucomicrobiae bacterium]|nr:LEPR-XLL domain-containing protein [Verrucomicrobiae bacterium]